MCNQNLFSRRKIPCLSISLHLLQKTALFIYFSSLKPYKTTALREAPADKALGRSDSFCCGQWLQTVRQTGDERTVVHPPPLLIVFTNHYQTP